MILNKYKNVLEFFILFIFVLYAYYSSIISGISWDEFFVFNRGEERLKYLFSFGNSKITYDQNEFFPGLNDSLAVFFTQLFPRNFEYVSLHIFNTSVSMLTLFGTYQLFKFLLNKRISKIIFLILFFNPIFFSHMAINSKDTLISFSFVWLLLYFLKYLKHQGDKFKSKKIIYALLLFFTIGIGTRFHFVSLLILFIPFLLNNIYFEKKKLLIKKLFLNIFSVTIISFFIVVLFWPHTHSNIFFEPFNYFFESLNLRTGPPIVFYNNEVIDTMKVPTFFYFDNLIFRSPEFVIFLYLIFFIFILFDFNYFKNKYKNINLVLISIFFIILYPFLIITFMKIPQYDGIRYFLFILPFFSVVPSFALLYAIDNFNKFYLKISSLVIVFLFFYYLFYFFTFNPYQYSYVSHLFLDKDKIANKFENDYWGISIQELIKKAVNENYLKKNKPILIGVCGFNVDIAKFELNKYKNLNYKITSYEDSDVDFIIANNRAHFRSTKNDQSKWYSCYKKLSGFDYMSLSKGKIDLSRIYKIKN
tara:strand:+ start:2307 stop:3902 length:1596 start_codon:yes stop_codon:yes gene_type:complete